MIDITRKQYLLTTEKRILPGMLEYPIGRFYLYAHPLMQVQTEETVNGQTVFLLGHAYCMDTAGKSAVEDIHRWDGEDSVALTRFWTGRWTLITETELITDAGGLMTAFYTQKDQNWYISTSLALLAQVAGKTLEKSVKETGLTWQLLPESRLEDTRGLLCTQKLILGDTLQAENHLWLENMDQLSGEEKCSQIGRLLVNGISNIHIFSGKNICAALTGGKDSRLVLAAILKAGVPFSAYTAEHSAISSADRKIPTVLAKKYGFSHRYIKKEKNDPQRLLDYDRFTAGNSNGADRQFYGCNQFGVLGEDTVVLRGGLFEAGQTYARGYTGDTANTFAAGMRRYYSDLSGDNAQTAAFENWLKNARENPIEFVDIRDRFYIEQRVGGWAAAIEQSLDINDFTSIQIANCAELLSVLLSATEEERKKLILAYGTIEALMPELMGYDINKSGLSDKVRRVTSILKNPLKKLRAYLSRRNGR